MKNLKQYLVKPGKKVKLADLDPGYTADVKDSKHADKLLEKHRQRLFDLQELLYAEDKHAFLVVLQGLDAAGKDGTIRHIFTGLNPQGCTVTPFKQPVGEETQHDYLWRVHKAAPKRGMIGIFNRSHYEEVLVVRVHQHLSRGELKRRFEHINAFERLLAETGTTIVKFFLHISREEQAKRLLARLEHPKKYWKVNEGDLIERKFWDQYEDAYEDVFHHCSTKYAPWYIIPADKKWFRNVVISRILVETLKGLKMDYPKPTLDLSKMKMKIS